MAPDTARLRAQLAQHLACLRKLEVIEAAEDVVRQYHLRLLAVELAGLRDQLAQAERHLAAARTDRNPGFLVLAEEHVCGIMRQTIVIERSVEEQHRTFKRANEAYRAQRALLIKYIDRLRQLLDHGAGPV